MLSGSHFSFSGAGSGAGSWVCAKLPWGAVGGWGGKQGSPGSREVWGEGEQNKSGSSAGDTAWMMGAPSGSWGQIFLHWFQKETRRKEASRSNVGLKSEVCQLDHNHKTSVFKEATLLKINCSVILPVANVMQNKTKQKKEHMLSAENISPTDEQRAVAVSSTGLCHPLNVPCPQAVVLVCRCVFCENTIQTWDVFKIGPAELWGRGEEGQQVGFPTPTPHDCPSKQLRC